MIDFEEAKGISAVPNPTAESPETVKRTKRTVLVRPYPTYSLEKALSIALAIKDKNAGNPWPPSQVAKAIGIGENSSYLDLLFRASQLYGLTTGSRRANSISLEKIGRDIAYAPNPDSELNAKRRAFLNVSIFAKVLEYYKGCNLPEMDFLSNTLQTEFELPKELHTEFRKLFVENCAFAEIGSEWQGLRIRAAPSEESGFWRWRADNKGICRAREPRRQTLFRNHAVLRKA